MAMKIEIDGWTLTLIVLISFFLVNMLVDIRIKDLQLQIAQGKMEGYTTDYKKSTTTIPRSIVPYGSYRIQNPSYYDAPPLSEETYDVQKWAPADDTTPNPQTDRVFANSELLGVSSTPIEFAKFTPATSTPLDSY